jgi:hypothetical protein
MVMKDYDRNRGRGPLLEKAEKGRTLCFVLVSMS